MVKLLIEATGEELDVIGRIGYTKQVADIGDVGKAIASRSWTLKVPKTYKNTDILDKLGVIGSSSNKPYEKIKVSLIDNGVSIVVMANLQVLETNKKEYKVNLTEGVVDFFRDLSNDKLGSLNLSSLTHERSRVSVIDSWSTEKPYKYLVASYNSKIRPDVDGITNFDITGLVPSVNVGWLLDNIFARYGWTHTGLAEAKSVWMSYPTANDLQESGSVSVALAYPSAPKTIWHGDIRFLTFIDLGTDDDYVTINSNGIILFTADGDYIVSMRLPRWDVPVDNFLHLEFGINSDTGNSNPFTPIDLGNNKYLFQNIQAGDRLDVYLRAEQIRDTTGNVYPMEGELFYIGFLTIERDNVSVIDFSIPLMDYGVGEFIKEIMMQTASIAVTNIREKRIDFITTRQRLQKNIVNIPKDKYLSTESERYVLNSYAQNNYLKHKYDEDDADYNDGNIEVLNENIKTQRDIFQSKSYSPLRNNLKVNFAKGERWLLIFKMFDIEVKQDNSGNIELEYKPLQERFYFSKARNETDGFAINDVLTPIGARIPIAVKWTWNDIVQKNYPSLQSILNKAKVIKCNLYMSSRDFTNFRFDKVYYIEDLAGYYLVNKITYDSDKGVTAEFIQITLTSQFIGTQS